MSRMEGIAVAGGAVLDAVMDDPDVEPAPHPVKAPKGWTWDRKTRNWRPKVRGPVLARLYGGHDDGRADGGPDPGGAASDGAGPEAEGGETDHDQGDPAPGWQSDTNPIVTFELDEEAKAEIHALIALAYLPFGQTLPLVDPYCFGPLGEDETSSDIIGAVSDIVCGSPRVAKWVASAAGLRPWIKLGYALKPVAVNAWRHHVTKSIDVDVDRDAKTFTVTKRDWSQYPAA